MIKWFLKYIDIGINKFLVKNVNNMPVRFVKMIAYYYTDARIRKLYLSRLGLIMGEGTYGNLGLSFTMNEDLSPCVIIGKNVSIAPNVTFITNCKPNNSEILSNNKYVKSKLIQTNGIIKIEDDVWLGTNCVIMPNITISKGSIIGAGSVLFEDTENFSIYAGVPAKKIRSIKNA